MSRIAFHWAPCPMPTAAPDDAVVVVAADLDAPTAARERWMQSLTAAEHARAQRFRFDRDRDRHRAGRGLLRHLLGALLGADPAAIAFHAGPRGKPYLAPHGAPQPLWFNMSDADGLALFAFSRRAEVGVDVERQRPLPELETIAATSLAPIERATLAALPDDERLRAFYRLWTRKEGYLKATGDGLLAPLQAFAVSCRADEPAALLHADADPHAAARWRLHALEPAAEFVGTAVVAADGLRVVCGVVDR